MLNKENYFNYIKPSRRIRINHPETYRLATPEEVANINQYAIIIKGVATFYEETLSKSKIDYVYKEKGKIVVLPVKYKLENFPHLTGINFAFKSAGEKFNYLKRGDNDSPIIIEKNNHTFEKPDVLHKIFELTQSKDFVLTELKDIRQVQNISFSKGIKDSNNELLIALHNFQPEFYQPKSLINIKVSSNYESVPENTVLGIFKETALNKNGIRIEPISLNKDSLNNIAITTEMLIAMKKYAENLGKLRQE